VSEPECEPLNESSYDANASYLYAIDLFNHGFYWEAHEAWEALWHAAGRRGPTADFLKGLIKLAAAGVKTREGRAAGVRQHAQRAAELLRTAEETLGPFAFAMNIPQLVAAAADISARADELIASGQPSAVRSLPLKIELASGSAESRNLL
jgi:hypothetical protein